MYGYQSDIPNHARFSCKSEIKTDKIKLLLNSLACFLPVCQLATSAETEELVKIIIMLIYLKEKWNRKIPTKQTHIHITQKHNEQSSI